MVTNKKPTTLRLSDRHQGILENLASSWNLSKNAVIEKLLDSATHTHKGDVTRAKGSSSSGLSYLNSDVTKGKGDVTLKGVEAEEAILSGLVLHFKDKSKMLLLDDWLWTITKTANGSQKVISKYIYISPLLSPGFTKSGLDLPSLSELVDNVAFWGELQEACDSNGTFIEDIVYPFWLVLYANETQKIKFLTEAKEKPPLVTLDDTSFYKLFGLPTPIAANELEAMQEPTSDVELSSNVNR